MAEKRAPPDDRRPAEPVPLPPGRVTPLGWILIAACPVLVALVVLAGRGTVAVVAFLLLALDVLALATALIAPPRRPRRKRQWGGGREGGWGL